MKEKILNYIRVVRDECQKMIVELRLKTMKKPILWLLGIYIVATASFVRANFDYADDYIRILWGPRCWQNFDRWVNVYLSGVFNDGYYMVDISPLSQWMALLFMAISGVLLLRLFADKDNISLWNLVAVIPMGISPYFLGCLSYKFDAPYMALSVLVSIFPFLFWRKRYGLFAITSFMGVFAMCNTYQASSGIYPMVVLILAVTCYLEGNSAKDIIKWVGLASIMYLGALIIYKVGIVKPVLSGYVSTEVAPLNILFATVVKNLKAYSNLVIRDVPVRWGYCYCLIVGLYIAKLTWRSKRNIFASFLLTVISALLGYVLSFGVYIALVKPGFGPRCMYGFYVYLSIVAAYSVTSWSKFFADKVVCFVLSWMCVIFCFAYGNMLAEEQQYRFFRTVELLRDIDSFLPVKHKTLEFKFANSVKSPIVVRATRSKYPMMGRLIYGAVAGYGEKQYLMSGYSYPGLKESSLSVQELKKKNMPKVVDNPWNTIYSDGKYALIDMHQN